MQAAPLPAGVPTPGPMPPSTAALSAAPFAGYLDHALSPAGGTPHAAPTPLPASATAVQGRRGRSGLVGRLASPPPPANPAARPAASADPAAPSMPQAPAAVAGLAGDPDPATINPGAAPDTTPQPGDPVLQPPVLQPPLPQPPMPQPRVADVPLASAAAQSFGQRDHAPPATSAAPDATPAPGAPAIAQAGLSVAAAPVPQAGNPPPPLPQPPASGAPPGPASTPPPTAPPPGPAGIVRAKPPDARRQPAARARAPAIPADTAALPPAAVPAPALAVADQASLAAPAAALSPPTAARSEPAEAGLGTPADPSASRDPGPAGVPAAAGWGDPAAAAPAPAAPVPAALVPATLVPAALGPAGAQSVSLPGAHPADPAPALVPAPAPIAAPADASAASPPTPPGVQVAQALVAFDRPDATTQRLTLRLHPEDLGQVQIRIDRPTDGPVSIQVSAERPETLDLLLRDQSGLQHALDQAGLSPDGRTLTFHLGQQTAGAADPSSGTGQDNAGQNHADQNNAGQTSHREAAASAGAGGGSADGFAGNSGGPSTSADQGADRRSGGRWRQAITAGASPLAATPPPITWLRAGIDITA